MTGAPGPSLMLSDALADLAEGRDPDRIAAYLYTIGLRGWPRDVDACPVANYLHAKLPGWGAIEVRSVVNASPPDGPPVRQPLPDAVLTFIVRFDSGDYGYLRAGRDPAPTP